MNIRYLISAYMCSALCLSACDGPMPQKGNEALAPISFEKVTLQDSFWLPRLKTQKQTLVPFSNVSR